MKKNRLEGYETVKERKTKFYRDNPEGTVAVELMSPPEKAPEFVMIRASVWRDASDMREGYRPDSQGISLSIAGGKGADRDAWTENAEESAVGRALDNLGYHGGTCSREEMEKATHHAKQRKTTKQQTSKSNKTEEDNTDLDALRNKLLAVARGKKIPKDRLKEVIFDVTGTDNPKELSKNEITRVIEHVSTMEVA